MALFFILLSGGTNMSRLSVIEGQQLVKVLQKLGFLIVRTKGRMLSVLKCVAIASRR